MIMPSWRDLILGTLLGLALLLSWLFGPLVTSVVSMLFLPFGAVALFAFVKHPAQLNYAVFFGSAALVQGISFIVALVLQWPLLT